MKIGLFIQAHRQTLISLIISIFLNAGLLALLMSTGYLFNANADERITAAARNSFACKADLRSDNIQVLSQDGAVTLLGTVAVEPQSVLAADIVAGLPGVKRVDNRLKIRALAHGGRGPGFAAPVISRPDLQHLAK
jgi:hypothetical protein